jgi:hypothetical protein
LVLLACGCAGAARERPAQNAAGSLEKVQSAKQGVCAGVSNIPGDAWSTDPQAAPKQPLGSNLLGGNAEVCARAPAGEAADDGGTLEVTLVFPVTDERWRTENWHLEVIRKDGLVVQAGMLTAGRAVPGICVLDTCLKENHTSVRLPDPWRADSYRIRLRHVPTRTRVDLAIALQ